MKVEMDLSKFFKANTPEIESVTDNKIVIYAGGCNITFTPTNDEDGNPEFMVKFEVL